MFCSFSSSRSLSESSFRLAKKKCLYSLLSYLRSWTGSCDRPLRGLGRAVELASSLFWINFVYLSLLPFLLCLVLFPPPFLLWHRRLGHVCSPRLRYLISTGLYLTLRFLLIWGALPFLNKLFLLLLLILCPKSILPLCYRKEDHPYMLFLTEQWKNLQK